MIRRCLIQALVGVVLIGLYFALAWLSVWNLPNEAQFSTLWAPTGLAVGLLLIFGYRALFCVAIGTFWVFMYSRGSVSMACTAVIGNTLEAATARFLVLRFIGERNPLNKVSDLFKFIVVAAIISPIFSATNGTLSGVWSNYYVWSHAGYIWFVWWLENMLGVLVVAPAVISLLTPFPPIRDRKRMTEAFAIFILLNVMCAVVFGGWLPAPAQYYPLEYLCIPILVWSALSFSNRGAALTTLILTIWVIAGTNLGYGPFVRHQYAKTLHLLQLYIGTNSIFTLVVAAIASENKRISNSLARSNSELERFAYLTSHDLQEPIRTIAVYSGLILKEYGGKLDTDFDKSFNFIMKASTRMKLLIDSLLAHSQLGRNLHIEAIDSTQAVKNAVANLQGSITECQATVHWKGLPQVSADLSLLTVVFQNIIANALKFRNGGTPKVEISAVKSGDKWVFKIEDNGIGISAQNFSKIFRLFQRVNVNTPGSGMGLAVCKKLIEEQGGSIWVESALGIGSKFFFSLPA